MIGSLKSKDMESINIVVPKRFKHALKKMARRDNMSQKSIIMEGVLLYEKSKAGRKDKNE